MTDMKSRTMAALADLVTSNPEKPNKLVQRLSVMAVPDILTVVRQCYGLSAASVDPHQDTYTCLGMRLVEDLALPPDTIELRDAEGVPLLRVVNIGL